MDDAALLREYVESGSEAALAELVQRHLGMVHSTALRLVGDAAMAKDVSQLVFIRLARKAAAIRQGNALGGWLYRATCFEAADTLRDECRRRVREEEAVKLSEQNTEPAAEWTALAPYLDEAMRHLKRVEQDALVLRFFENQPLAEVGRRLGLSEEAARKRVSRALERMRIVFARRGVRVSALALGAAIAANAAQAMPTGWAASVTGTALAHAAPASAISGTLIWLAKCMVMTKAQATLVGLLFVAGVATPFLADTQANSRKAEAPGDYSKHGRGSANQLQGAAWTGVDRLSGAQPAGSPALERLTAWLLHKDETNTGGAHYDELRAMIWSLAATDYPQAWRLQERLRSRGLRRLFQQSMVDYWSKLDPQAALHAAESISEVSTRIKAVERALLVWAEKDPARALAWVRQSSPESRRDSRLGLAVQAMAGTDPQGALAAMNELPPGVERERATRVTVHWWARQQPQAAAHFVTQMPFSEEKTRLLWTTAESWAGHDPLAACQWVDTLGDRRERVHTIIPTVRSLVGGGRFLEAAEFLRGHADDFVEDPGEVSNRGLTPILSTWVGSDLAAARSWATQLPEGRFREEAMGSLLFYWSYEKPGEAAAFAATLPAGSIQQEGMKAALRRWCDADAQAAVNWVAALPAGAAQDSAWVGVCDGLGKVRPVEAAKLVASLPPGDVQTKGALSVVKGWAMQDPASAAAWVAAFPEGRAHDEASKAVFQQWTSRDAPAAAAWLKTLPESTRQALTKR